MLSSAQKLEIAAFAKQRSADEALREVLPICAAEGVRVLGAKGIVSSRVLYAKPEQRYFSDVDLRIAPSDVVRLSRKLGERFEILPVRQQGAFSLVAKGMLVEFESTNGSPGLASVGIEEVLGRARCVDWYDAPLYVAELHDHVASLIVNAFKDKLWHCPPWSLEDLMRATSHQEFRESTLLQRIRGAGLSSVARVVAEFLETRASSEPLHSAAWSAAQGWRKIADGLYSSRPMYEWAAREAFQDPEGVLARVVMRFGNDAPANRLKALTSVASSFRS